MKNNQIPIQNPNYVLDRQENEYQLLDIDQQTSIFINESASLIWQLCNGEQTVSQIKTMIKDSYPDMADTIDEGVDQTVEMLESHQALSVK